MAIPPNDIDEADRSDPPQSRFHVVMLVANDVQADTRVRKMAESLASTGVKVSILGLDHRGEGSSGNVGRANLVVAKVGRRFRNARSRKLRGRSKAYWSKTELVFMREQFQLQQRGVAAQIEWVREAGFLRRESIGGKAIDRKERTLRRYASTRAALKQRSFDSNRVSRAVSKGSVGVVDKSYQATRSLHRVRTNADFRLTEVSTRWHERLLRRRLMFKKRRLDSRIGRLKRKLIREQNPNLNRVPIRIRSGNWRRDLPELNEYEETLGPLLDALDADVFHAHDVHLLGVAARAAARARYRGVNTRVIYDAHEYIAGLARYTPKMIEAYTSIEREYIHHADRVITVSEPLADLLQRDFDLSLRPKVVLNIPVAGDPDASVPSLYSVAGVPLDADIMVYSGGMDEARNVHTIVRALPFLAGHVHLVLVAKSRTGYINSLFELAKEMGVENRVHLAPFVDPNDVVAYLSEAAIGVHPMISSKMNHQIALPNKLFEYLHAGLPMCVSDNRAMMDFVTETGVGEWFIAEDAESLADAVTTVLADRDRYVQARWTDPDLLKRFSWDRQAERMVEVYRDVLEEPGLQRDRFTTEERQESSGEFVSGGDPVSSPTVRLAIGPHNHAGQASLWAHAVEQNIPDIVTSVFMIARPEKIPFPASNTVEVADWWNARWQSTHRQDVLDRFSHVLIESGSTILGGRRNVHFDDEIDALASNGIEIALVFHGSDIRSPEIHRSIVDASPFHADDDVAASLETSTARMLKLVSEFDGSVFISTKDLWDYIPNAIWLPQVVETEKWASPPAPIGERLLVVASTFNNRYLKGADEAEAICNALAAEGRIEYRRYGSVVPERMPEVVAGSDVLIDGIVLGLYGTTSVEGMAAGRLVLGNIDRVIDKPGEVPPIVNANPSNLGDILVDITDRPGHYLNRAREGPGFVRRYHDGRYSAEQLAGFLGVSTLADMWSDDRMREANQP